jgi:hypothetical protein
MSSNLWQGWSGTLYGWVEPHILHIASIDNLSIRFEILFNNSFVEHIAFNMDRSKPTTAIPEPWSINTWQSKSIAQPIIYEDEDKLSKTLVQLAALPDLVPTQEIDQLCETLLFAARGQMFVVQGGDCAEAFHEITRPIVSGKRELLVAQAKTLSEGLGKPIIPIGRIAGQYSKPRSNCYETLSCGSRVNSVSFVSSVIKNRGIQLTLTLNSIEATMSTAQRSRSETQTLSVSASVIT